jgi:peptidoglycan/xylan/chitin deacetylase (PgdA/CDA1 family)
MRRISMKYTAVTILLIVLIGGIYGLTVWPEAKETIAVMVNAPVYQGKNNAVLCIVVDEHTTAEMLEALMREEAEATFFFTQYGVSNVAVIEKIKDMRGEFAVAGPGDDADLARETIETVRGFAKENGLSLAPYYMPLTDLRAQAGDAARDLGLSLIQCGVDSLDTQLQGSEEISHAVLKNLRQGSFVLLHGYYRSAAALGEIISGAKEMGVTFGTVDDALK